MIHSKNGGYYCQSAEYPNFDTYDTLEDYIKELKHAGRWEELVEYIQQATSDMPQPPRDSHLELIRALVIEFQTENPQLTIDAFSYATGLNAFGALTLRHYAKRNAITPEGFSKRVDELRRRFQLDLPANEPRTA